MWADIDKDKCVESNQFDIFLNKLVQLYKLTNMLLWKKFYIFFSIYCFSLNCKILYLMESPRAYSAHKCFYNVMHEFIK